MAYAALFSLARTLKRVQVEDQIQVLFGAKINHESLCENILRLLKFLEEFPEEHAPTVRPLEEAIRDAAYELEDHIEKYVTISDKSLVESTDDKKNSYLIMLKETLHTHIEGAKSMIEHVGSIMDVATELNSVFAAAGDSSIGSYTSSSASGTSTTAPSEQEKLVGVGHDLIQIKDRVTGYDLNLQIIPIVGTGGIGKTTLARNVYSDLLIEQHFDVRHWVTVSQEYRVPEVLQGLLSKDGAATTDHVESLIVQVYKSLKNRRYLIVLDDMWHDEVWDRVRRAFPDDNNGSRIIVTTRLSDLALVVDSPSPLHRMEFLNEDQSWDLLRERVYGQEHCPQQLQEVGKVIARNCRGLPLTIVVIAGLLKVNKTRDYWESVAKNINEAIATNDDEFFTILSLSYDNLPHHLKACFLYMGIFPEDYNIPINKLIKLWVAEGFLKPSRSKKLEEVAEEYLDDLVNRNLVLVTKKRSDGRIKFCGIHDVLRELSLKRGQDEKFLQHYRYQYVEHNQPEVPSMQRRWIIHTEVGSKIFDIQISPTDALDSPIRSLLYIYGHEMGILPFTPQFWLLRVVDGLKITLKCFPEAIFELVNLRHLALAFDYSYTSCFPAGVTKLKNLETLITNDPHGYTSLYSMPSEIWKMPRLKHLVLNRGFIMPILEHVESSQSYSILHNLQTLHVIDLPFTKKVIERLPNLEKLKVKYGSCQHYRTNGIKNLVYLHRLQVLNFELVALPYDLPSINRFPRNLRKLTLRGSWIPLKKMSIVNSLPNLEVLKLLECSVQGRKWEITDEFPSLKHLEMEGINLEDWIVDSDRFPCLRRLIIRECCYLKEVPESIGDIATLQILTIKRCNSSVEESARRIQEQQQSMEIDDLKVHIVPAPANEPY